MTTTNTTTPINREPQALIRSGVFKNRSDMIHYLLMRCIRDSGEAVGSWTLKAHLEAVGLDCSTATIGRHLKDMDSREFTVRQSNQGRLLTPLGDARLERYEESLTRAVFSDAVSDALRVNRFDELVDLLRTRQALETEVARQAAERHVEGDKELLQRALGVHQDCIDHNLDPTNPALDFHSAVVPLSHNKFMIAILDMLIHEEKRIELLFVDLVTRERGKAYVADHAVIADAILQRDGDRAADLMNRHMGKICRDIILQAKEKNGVM